MRASIIPILLFATTAQAAPPNAATKAANAALVANLDFTDIKDFDFAARGFIAAPEDPLITNAKGQPLRDFREDAAFTGPAPASVNPSLWRNAQLVSKHGLFKLTEGIWQLRGFDLAVMTVIAGKTGWIIVDPLTSEETAAAALALANKHLGDRPVAAVIYTHSHADHFGGAGGIVPAGSKIPIYAPQGFMEHAVAENVIAGPAMTQRAEHMFGQHLPHTPDARVSAGLGPLVVNATLGLVAPTIEVTPETLIQTIDGIRFEFQLTPGTEAQAEMNFYLPDHKALCMAENANASMHNILTPRGALVRDTKNWAAELLAARRSFASRSDVMFTSHFWPRWGSQEIDQYLLTTRKPMPSSTMKASA
jgi:alkyl sulfatase BDS1-like metallo-beta-lactamase superfamily hydrolase